MNLTIRFSNPVYLVTFSAALLLIGWAIGARWGHSAAVVSAIKSEESEIMYVVSALTSEIALLREYRTRLISDVVTGKLDVRCIEFTYPYAGRL